MRTLLAFFVLFFVPAYAGEKAKTEKWKQRLVNENARLISQNAQLNIDNAMLSADKANLQATIDEQNQLNAFLLMKVKRLEASKGCM